MGTTLSFFSLGRKKQLYNLLFETMMDGKSWLAGQNWVDQFLRNCANSGNTEMIEKVSNGNSFYRLIYNTSATFASNPEGDRIWIERGSNALKEGYLNYR